MQIICYEFDIKMETTEIIMLKCNKKLQRFLLDFSVTLCNKTVFMYYNAMK